MRHLLSFFCLLGFAAWSSLAAEETRDLILVAGQSNAVGYDANPSELPSDAADKEILFWWRCGDPLPDEYDSTCGGKWTTLQAQPKGTPRLPKQGREYGNFSSPEGGFGPEMGLGRTLHDKEGKRLAIVKAAFSGTSMAGDWDHNNPGNGGACYRSLVAETKAAIAAAKAQGITLRVRALAWVQGESDANAGAAQKYEQALGEMITALRKDLEAPEMLALVGVNTKFGGGRNVFMPKIVEAQQALSGKNSRCAYVDTSSAATANAAHWNAAGTLEVGRMFADTLMKLRARTEK